jgi:outer membrane protein assembly factor BamB
MKILKFICLIAFVTLGCCKDKQPNVTPAMETIWKTPLSNGEETASTNPIVYKDLVIYAANDDGDINKSKLIALNNETGQKMWEWKNNNQQNGYIPPNYTYLKDNILICPILGKPYQIVAINVDNGQQLWHTTLPEAGSWQLTGIDNSVFQIRGNYDKMKDEIFVADIKTGNWISIYKATNINAPVYIRGIHAYKSTNNKNSLAFLVAKYKDFNFSETESTIIKYDIDSNKIIYEKKLDFLPKKSDPTLAVVSSDKFWLNIEPVVALSENTGEKILEIPAPFISNVAGKIAVWDNKLFMTTVTKLFCFNATTGQQLWQEEENTSGSPSRILYYNNTIYYTSIGNGNFHVIDASNGKSLYNINSPDKKTNGKGGFDSVITLDTQNNKIYTATYYSAICYKMPK